MAVVCHMYLFVKDHLMLHNTVFTVLLQNMSRATGQAPVVALAGALKGTVVIVYELS